jgi:predicted AlkP superfamily pyrophosphatase or phosphodiesterase
MKAILQGYFGLVLLGVTFMSGCNDEPQPKVLFVIVDGIPADVLENTATPVLDAISGETGYTRSYVGGAVGEASESPTISAVGYNHLLTGTWSNKHNVWGNDIVAPNYDYWDIFRIAKEHDASLQTAIFSTWTDNRTKLIGDGLDAAGGKKLDHISDGYELDLERFPHDEMHDYIRNIDVLVAKEAANHVKNHGPDLSWVYLQYTDDVSHGYGDGPEFTAAVQMMDVMMGEIWSAVQHRQSSFNEDWLVIVTTDHGRDAETGSDHGGQTDRERTTWIVTNSQNLNERFAATPAIVDILPSIAAHMKLDMPADIREQLDGQSFID